jgi:hypothetical protein
MTDYFSQIVGVSTPQVIVDALMTTQGEDALLIVPPKSVQSPGPWVAITQERYFELLGALGIALEYGERGPEYQPYTESRSRIEQTVKEMEQANEGVPT